MLLQVVLAVFSGWNGKAGNVWSKSFPLHIWESESLHTAVVLVPPQCRLLYKCALRGRLSDCHLQSIEGLQSQVFICKGMGSSSHKDKPFIKHAASSFLVNRGWLLEQSCLSLDLNALKVDKKPKGSVWAVSIKDSQYTLELPYLLLVFIIEKNKNFAIWKTTIAESGFRLH